MYINCIQLYQILYPPLFTYSIPYIQHLISTIPYPLSQASCTVHNTIPHSIFHIAYITSYILLVLLTYVFPFYIPYPIIPFSDSISHIIQYTKKMSVILSFTVHIFIPYLTFHVFHFLSCSSLVLAANIFHLNIRNTYLHSIIHISTIIL